MDQQQIALKLTMDALGLPLQMRAFADRLILQKAVYLAQAAGANLGYSFRWYLYGPYCPALAEDAFAVASELREGSDESRKWSLDDTSQTRLAEIRSLVQANSRPALARRLELLASVLFLLRTRQAAKNKPEQMMDTLKRFGKDFRIQDIRTALGALKRTGLS